MFDFQLQIRKNSILSKIRNSLSNAGAISTKFLYRITISIMVLAVSDLTGLAFQKMIEDILAGKVNCVIVKDLSRLGRDYITTGYYIEVIFPANGVRFVSVNDQFDTIDGITNQEHPYSSRIRVPIINAFNEQTSIEIKKKVEATLDMKAQQGTFIGPRAPFGYQKSESNHDKLIPDPKAAIVVRKIFELAANGTGMTAIVRYLNEKNIPTPIQYARSKGLAGNYDDGNGDWNSRSVKYILTNRTYTGMLYKEKKRELLPQHHEPLVDTDTLDASKVFKRKRLTLPQKANRQKMF